MLNRIQTILLLASMFGFSALLGWLLWGLEGLLALLVVSTFLILFTPSISPTLIMGLYRGKRLSPHELPGLQTSLQTLAERSGLKTPDIYYIPSRVINAFAVGTPSRAGIAITDGLIHSLSLREATNVIAHELSHIRNNDLRVMSIADVFTRLTSTLSFFGQILLLVNLPLIVLGTMSINWLAIILLIFAPITSTLAQLGLSRTREYDADLNAARLTGDPEGLARALVKIDTLQGGWLERIFLPGHKQPDPSLIRTHPLTEDRVRRLLALKQSENFLGQHQDAHEDAHAHPLSHNFMNDRVTRHPKRHFSGLWH